MSILNCQFFNVQMRAWSQYLAYRLYCAVRESGERYERENRALHAARLSKWNAVLKRSGHKSLRAWSIEMGYSIPTVYWSVRMWNERTKTPRSRTCRNIMASLYLIEATHLAVELKSQEVCVHNMGLRYWTGIVDRAGFTSLSEFSTSYGFGRTTALKTVSRWKTRDQVFRRGDSGKIAALLLDLESKYGR